MTATNRIDVPEKINLAVKTSVLHTGALEEHIKTLCLEYLELWKNYTKIPFLIKEFDKWAVDNGYRPYTEVMKTEEYYKNEDFVERAKKEYPDLKDPELQNSVTQQIKTQYTEKFQGVKNMLWDLEVYPEQITMVENDITYYKGLLEDIK